MTDVNETNIANFTPSEQREQLRMLEALLLAASEPLDLATLSSRLPQDADI